MKRLIDDLENLGIVPGAAVLVHSSLRSLAIGADGAAALWDALRQAVGSEGTVLVPTLSYATVNHDNPVFDVRSTESCVGAFPEYVRNQARVVRSVHPTHSVAGAGREAGALLNGHIQDRTPAGPNSPFRRLRDAGGFILMVGCGLNPNTSMHGVEELSHPPYLFAGETEFTCVDASGRSFAASYRCHGHFAQHYDRITRLLTGSELRRGAVGGAECYLIDAEALWQKADQALRSDPLFFTREHTGEKPR